MTAIDPVSAGLQYDNTSNARRDALRAGLLAALLAVGTLFAFLPAARCGFVNFDDGPYVYENPIVQRGLTWGGLRWAFTTGTLANYHPLTWLSLMLDSTLWGDSPAGFHLTNLLLHAANAVLLLLVLRAMTGATWRAALVAAIFALHPLRVESVAWISARKDCLAGFFGLLAIGAYVAYASRPTIGRYAVVAILFIASLLCKAMFITLPAILLLLDAWPLRRDKPWRALAIEKLPLLVIAAAAGLVTLAAQQAGGAVATIERYSVLHRVANATVAYVSYIRKMLAPTDLAAFYPHWRTVAVGLVAIAIAALAMLTILAFLRRRTSPALAIGWLWFLITLIPMIGLVQVGGQALADRYTYLPMIGLAIAIAWSLPAMPRIIVPASFIVLLSLALLTRQQIGHWRDSVALWTHALGVTANNHVAHTNLAVELARLGNLPDAEQHYRAALAIRPEWSVAHNGLAVLLAGRGESDAAIDHYRTALRSNPRYAIAHRNLANQLLARGRNDEAIAHYQEAVSLRPDDATAHLLLGLALARRGEIASALGHFELAVRHDPADPEARLNLGRALSETGRPDAALRAFDEALRLRPDLSDAHYHAGAALLRLGRLDEAERRLRACLALAPADVEAQAALRHIASRRHSAAAVDYEAVK